MSEARVKVSLPDGGVIEIDGTEVFVIAQLERFAEKIGAGLNAKGGQPPAADALDDVFAATDTGVRIVTDIPGGSVHEKMINAAKLLAYGIARLTNRTVVLFAEVRAACKSHRCYDSTHLSSALKTQRAAFVFAGSGRRQAFQLSASGVRDAERLIQQLRAAGSPRPIGK